MANVVNYVVDEMVDMHNASESDMINVVRHAKSILEMLKSEVHSNMDTYNLPIKYSGPSIETALEREIESCNTAISRLNSIKLDF